MYLLSTNKDHAVTIMNGECYNIAGIQQGVQAGMSPGGACKGPSCAGWLLKIAPRAWWLTQSYSNSFKMENFFEMFSLFLIVIIE